MNEKYLIPLSLIISSLILGTGIYFTTLSKKEIPKKKEDASIDIKKVNILKDHIQGSTEADIFIVEYSDLECIGCKAFSKLKKELIEKYKNNNKVAFVYRHFPLYKSFGDAEPLHPTAGVEARATECVAKLSSEENFFKMKDRIFETTKSDGKYPVENLVSLAEEFGINEKDFSNCVDSDEIKNKIENS
jgi:protein-disulfide isomerase